MKHFILLTLALLAIRTCSRPPEFDADASVEATLPSLSAYLASCQSCPGEMPDLDDYLHPQFEALAGKHLAKIRLFGLEDTLYRLFREKTVIRAGRLLTEQKKQIDKTELDMALIADNVYAPGVVHGTDWRPVYTKDEVRDSTLKQLVSLINDYNRDGSGFYAQLYRNFLTENYCIAFRGSEFSAPKEESAKSMLSTIRHAIADPLTNVSQLSSTTKQHQHAAAIGELIKNSPQQFVVVGHSLGGGLAVAASLKSGAPAYTFNQAELSRNTLKTLDLDTAHHKNNIKSYYANIDIVTNVQKIYTSGESGSLIPLGRKINVGNALSGKKPSILSAPFTAHKISSMLNYFSEQNREAQAQWEAIQRVETHIYRYLPLIQPHPARSFDL